MSIIKYWVISLYYTLTTKLLGKCATYNKVYLYFTLEGVSTHSIVYLKGTTFNHVLFYLWTTYMQKPAYNNNGYLTLREVTINGKECFTVSSGGYNLSKEGNYLCGKPIRVQRHQLMSVFSFRAEMENTKKQQDIMLCNADKTTLIGYDEHGNLLATYSLKDDIPNISVVDFISEETSTVKWLLGAIYWERIQDTNGDVVLCYQQAGKTDFGLYREHKSDALMIFDKGLLPDTYMRVIDVYKQEYLVKYNKSKMVHEDVVRYLEEHGLRIVTCTQDDKVFHVITVDKVFCLVEGLFSLPLTRDDLLEYLADIIIPTMDDLPDTRRTILVNNKRYVKHRLLKVDGVITFEYNGYRRPQFFEYTTNGWYSK